MPRGNRHLADGRPAPSAPSRRGSSGATATVGRGCLAVRQIRCSSPLCFPQHHPRISLSGSTSSPGRRLIAGLPIKAAPQGAMVRSGRLRGLERRAWPHSGNSHAVRPFVPEGDAWRQATTLRPGEVCDETRALPGADLQVGVLESGLCAAAAAAAAEDAPPEEGQVPSSQVDAHAALEAAARRRRWQGLDVGAFDLTGRLPDLPLPNNRAGVRAEGHAAAAAGLEVHHREAKVVCIGNHLHLQVHATVVGV
mmetsp:Transcript_1143/g.2699  ORF Transcript_1143/g.2699 Transcript_1143/m.2699 type:complete len:252 (-) Transcript_1143:709-1464(-)